MKIKLGDLMFLGIYIIPIFFVLWVWVTAYNIGYKNGYVAAFTDCKAYCLIWLKLKGGEVG